MAAHPVTHLKVRAPIRHAVVIAGAQIPLEDVPSVQKEIVVRCRQMGKPVIIASHLLQSMMEYPTPTRAEARLLTNPPQLHRTVDSSGIEFPQASVQDQKT